ncbi:MAG TPA: hypothetical protein PLK99_00275 [Burkholderiales bacterium]|nr:hypothetical protein [Burkholderiales bacterium]
MKKIAFALFAMMSVPAFADVGVSIAVGEPGFYGSIDIGGFPPPQVIYAQPVIVERSERSYAPIYLRVPPGYERHWERHCREYRACGRPVYFVRDKWYRDVYSPRYRERHGMGRHEERGRRDEGRDRGYRDDDRERDYRR